MEKLYKEIGLSEKLKYNKIIDKENFFKLKNINENDKIILTEYCEEIVCKYKLFSAYFNMENLSDEDQMYNEIIILEATINNEMASYDIMNILGRYILYPIIVILKCKNKFKIEVAKTSCNQKDFNLNKQKGLVSSSWYEKDFLIGKIINIIDSIKNININELNNLKEMYQKIYDIILVNQASYTTIPKFIKLLKNTIGVENEKTIRNEILDECFKIVEKYNPVQKYNRDKTIKYNYEGMKGTTFLIDTEELWAFINKREFYKKRLEGRKIDSYLELTYRDQSFYN